MEKQNKVRLSKSKIGSFKQCPFRYYKESIEGVKSDVVPEQLKKGIECHELFELSTRQILNNNKYSLYKEDMDNFIDWRNEMKFEIVSTEEKFYDEELNFSGVVDLIAKDQKGIVYLIDYKTGKGKDYLSSYNDELYYYVYLAEKYKGIKIDVVGVFFSGAKKFLCAPVDREKITKFLEKIKQAREEILKCMKEGVWDKRKSPLCGWCSLYQNKHCEGEDGDLFDEVVFKNEN